jgi:molybdopterin-guanine dinucleotide biosynthesis protein A
MGRDKALLDFDGEPLWQRQLNTLRQLRPGQLLISGPPRKDWEECEVIADEIADAGPLAGVSMALRSCTSPLLVVLAIDLPMMTADYLFSLLALSNEEQGVVPVSSRGLEPLAAIYPRSCRQLADASLQSGDFSMHGFVHEACQHGLLRRQPVAPNDLELFTNLNTVADYERARSRPVRQNR